MQRPRSPRAFQARCNVLTGDELALGPAPVPHLHGRLRGGSPRCADVRTAGVGINLIIVTPPTFVEHFRLHARTLYHSVSPLHRIKRNRPASSDCPLVSLVPVPDDPYILVSHTSPPPATCMSDSPLQLFLLFALSSSDSENPHGVGTSPMCAARPHLHSSSGHRT